MKKWFALFLLTISSFSWGCILIEGKIKVNSDYLKVHQKFNLNEDYPYRTKNYIVHMRLRSADHDALVVIKHPKTLKTLFEEVIHLKNDEETHSHYTSKEITFESKLTLKKI